MEFLEFVSAHHLQNYVYLVLFFGMLVEGMAFLLTVMFLVAQKLVQPLPALISVSLGALLEPFIWYYVA